MTERKTWPSSEARDQAYIDYALSIGCKQRDGRVFGWNENQRRLLDMKLGELRAQPIETMR